MDDNDYDESSRYLCRRAKAPMMHWLLELDATHLHFDSWLDSVLTWQGSKERICDAVARMSNLDGGGIPCAGIVEFQTAPDPDMFGRMLIAGGLVWLTVKPAKLPGDRFELCAIVVNLTGEGDCSRHMTLGTAEWVLKPCERNLSMLDADKVLDEIVAGMAPREILAWIPLMKKGGEDDTIRRWLEIAKAEPDLGRRGDYALARVFAGLVGLRDVWTKALEGLTMNESPVVREWRAEARRAGRLEGQVELLLGVLRRRLPPVPEDLVARLGACSASDPLERWLDAAYAAKTIEEFRREAGL